jgi:hypothetical protein
MVCKRCLGTEIVLVRVPDCRGLAGYALVTKSCPECRKVETK